MPSSTRHEHSARHPGGGPAIDEDAIGAALASPSILQIQSVPHRSTKSPRCSRPGAGARVPDLQPRTRCWRGNRCCSSQVFIAGHEPAYTPALPPCRLAQPARSRRPPTPGQINAHNDCSPGLAVIWPCWRPTRPWLAHPLVTCLRVAGGHLVRCAPVTPGGWRPQWIQAHRRAARARRASPDGSPCVWRSHRRARLPSPHSRCIVDRVVGFDRVVDSTARRRGRIAAPGSRAQAQSAVVRESIAPIIAPLSDSC